MTQFIKLTECNGNAVLINTNRIEHITKGSKGFDTYIKLLNNPSTKLNEAPNKENYFFVKESIEDIWNMLDNNQLVSMDIIP